MTRIERIIMYISFTLYLIKWLACGNPGLHGKVVKVGSVITRYDSGLLRCVARSTKKGSGFLIDRVRRGCLLGSSTNRQSQYI